MYSHYLPDEDWMVLDDEVAQEPPPQERLHTQTSYTSNAVFQELSGGLSQMLEGVTKHFSLEHIDTGDILLVLILLFLFLEGDNLELVITLGLMLLLGLGGDEEKDPP